MCSAAVACSDIVGHREFAIRCAGPFEAARFSHLVPYMGAAVEYQFRASEYQDSNLCERCYGKGGKYHFCV